MTPSLKNYGRNDTPFLEICINTKDKSLNDSPNEIFHFFLIPIQKMDKMTLLPLEVCINKYELFYNKIEIFR